LVVRRAAGQFPNLSLQTKGILGYVPHGHYPPNMIVGNTLLNNYASPETYFVV